MSKFAQRLGASSPDPCLSHITLSKAQQLLQNFRKVLFVPHPPSRFLRMAQLVFIEVETAQVASFVKLLPPWLKPQVTPLNISHFSSCVAMSSKARN